MPEQRSRGSSARRAGAALGLALVAAACNEQQFQPGVAADLTPPVVVIDKLADTLTVEEGLKFSVAASDNLGLKTLSIETSGGVLVDIDSVFTTQVTSIVVAVDSQFPSNTTAGGTVVITALATDGAGNSSETATDSIVLTNIDALIVTLDKPVPGATTAPGKTFPVEVSASQRDGVSVVGYFTEGNLVVRDSIVLAAAATDTTHSWTVSVPDTTSLGTMTVRGFGIDTEGRRTETAALTVSIQSTVNDTLAPVVTFTVSGRVEDNDTITINATDPSGITQVGWTAVLVKDTTTLVGQGDTTFDGTSTAVEWTDIMEFADQQVGERLIIKAYAVDAASPPNDSRTTPSGSAPAAAAAQLQAAQQAAEDTVLFVHGATRALPAGGLIADAIYNRNQDSIYFTNYELDRIEVFRVSDTSFVGSIPVGSRPWGMALWPRDVNGDNADTVVVANSGGTNLSIVDMISGVEVRRHQLPIFRIQSVQTKIDEATGQIKDDITEYIISDRPQFVGTVCRNPGPPCGDVVAVYSTTPTGAQSKPLDFRSTIRWENLTSAAPESHFFWEHAAELISDVTDTLQVIVRRGTAASEEVILGAICGRIVTIKELGFIDTTYVRNSGDFTHVLIGEGGGPVQDPPLLFARAMGYTVTAGVDTTQCAVVDTTVVPPDTTALSVELEDLGITGSVNVRDFIANTAIPVRSIAINFNGLTNMIRADSVYVLDENMRLQGLIAVGGGPGMDLNFDHTFDAQVRGTNTIPGDGDADSRLMFAATGDPEIEVFDTYFYGRVGFAIPIKDPIIGPLRVAKRGTSQILVGVTARGVVYIELPSITNSFPAAKP